MAVSHYLPEFLQRRLAGRETLQRAVDNSFWLFCDQALRMAAGLIVGVWVARYLGPERYGWLSYALSMVGLVGSFASFGMNPVVVRELARDPATADECLRSAMGVKAFASTGGFLVCVAVAWARGVPAVEVRPLIVVVAMGLLFQWFDVMDLLFQAHGEPRRSAWIRMGSCLAVSLLKVALILSRASLIAFAAAGVVETALNAAGWTWAAARRGFIARAVRWNRRRAVALVRESFPLALSALAIYAQAYADQLVLGTMLGGSSLGQYAAAVRLVTVFAFVPTIVYTVSAPEITRARRDDPTLYWKRLHRLYRTMLWLFVAIAVPLIVVGPVVTRALYGPAYAAAGGLLPLLALRLFFTNFGMARSVFITNEGLFSFALSTAIAGAVINLGLNLWWVPHWGAKGAIAASLVSFAATTFAFDGLHPRMRANLRVMARAVLLPWSPHVA